MNTLPESYSVWVKSAKEMTEIFVWVKSPVNPERFIYPTRISVLDRGDTFSFAYIEVQKAYNSIEDWRKDFDDLSKLKKVSIAERLADAKERFTRGFDMSFDTFFPVPEARRNSDDMSMPGNIQVPQLIPAALVDALELGEKEECPIIGDTSMRWRAELLRHIIQEESLKDFRETVIGDIEPSAWVDCLVRDAAKSTPYSVIYLMVFEHFTPYINDELEALWAKAQYEKGEKSDEHED